MIGSKKPRGGVITEEERKISVCRSGVSLKIIGREKCVKGIKTRGKGGCQDRAMEEYEVHHPTESDSMDRTSPGRLGKER